MDDKELADTIKELYTKYADLNVVAEKLGISVELVKKHVTLARLPESLKGKVEETKIPLDEIDGERDSREIGDLKDFEVVLTSYGIAVKPKQVKQRPLSRNF